MLAPCLLSFLLVFIHPLTLLSPSLICFLMPFPHLFLESQMKRNSPWRGRWGLQAEPRPRHWIRTHWSRFGSTAAFSVFFNGFSWACYYLFPLLALALTCSSFSIFLRWERGLLLISDHVPFWYILYYRSLYVIDLEKMHFHFHWL